MVFYDGARTVEAFLTSLERAIARGGFQVVTRVTVRRHFFAKKTYFIQEKEVLVDEISVSP